MNVHPFGGFLRLITFNFLPHRRRRRQARHQIIKMHPSLRRGRSITAMKCETYHFWAGTNFRQHKSCIFYRTFLPPLYILTSVQEFRGLDIKPIHLISPRKNLESHDPFFLPTALQYWIYDPRVDQYAIFDVWVGIAAKIHLSETDICSLKHVSIRDLVCTNTYNANNL